MNKIKFTHIVFNLALIAALAIAAIPIVPAHALSNSSSTAVTVEKPANATILAPATGVVCKSVVIWRNGHRTVVRRCHKVTNQDS